MGPDEKNQMDTCDIAPLTRRCGVSVSVFCAFEITPRLVGRAKLSLTILMDYKVEEREWKYTMTYSYSRIFPFFSFACPCTHMKSILRLCPCQSEIDVHIKVTKTNCILYFPSAVPVSTRHQGATSIYSTCHQCTSIREVSVQTLIVHL